MHSGTQLQFDEWFSRRAALLTGFGAWALGFVLAGASAWRIEHPRTWTDAQYAAPPPTRASTAMQGTQCDATSNEGAVDTADTVEPQEGIVFMPSDVIVGRTGTRTGVTQMQQERP